MTIILDAMGSDQYPDPEIQAAVTAAELFGEEIILVGNRALIEPKLKALNTKNLPILIEDAPDLVEMGEKPVEAALMLLPEGGSHRTNLYRQPPG